MLRGYPAWFSRNFVSGNFSLLFFSGLLLLPTTIETKLEMDMFWRLPGDQRILTAAIHALASLVTLILLGALWSIHMRSEWKKKINRGSAITVVALFAILLVSSIGIYYAGESELSFWSSIIHACAGLLISIPYLIHVYFYKKK